MLSEGKIVVNSIYKKGRKGSRETGKNTPIKLKTRQLPDGVVAGSVGVGLGQTINLGNFESVKVDVHVYLPALPEEVEDAYRKALSFCKKHLAENVSEIIDEREKEY